MQAWYHQRERTALITEFCIARHEVAVVFGFVLLRSFRRQRRYLCKLGSKVHELPLVFRVGQPVCRCNCAAAAAAAATAAVASNGIKHPENQNCQCTGTRQTKGRSVQLTNL